MSNFATWYSKLENQERIDLLSENERITVNRILEAELSHIPTFDLRSKYLNDLSGLNFNSNQIVSELIASIVGAAIPPESSNPLVNFFDQVPPKSDQERISDTLISDGYCLSPISLNLSQLDKLKNGLKRHQFLTKGKRPNKLTGERILNSIQHGICPPVDDGDTYWLEDMNGLAQDPLFAKFAFDPYIVSVASNYLGCVPIHVQTNAWFSFPGESSKNNLSMNGQLFHQDKEFIKFFKVFVYLSDVGIEQGPHSYIAGSQHDELHHKGVAISGRVTDDNISKYYDLSRIKTVLGPAGSILFGDTSCVHKGYSVKSGSRIMLQFEYASSLYLSPVPPFNDLHDSQGILSQYSKNVSNRLTLNYSSGLREQFDKFSHQSSKPTLITKLRILASRVKKWLFCLF